MSKILTFTTGVAIGSIGTWYFLKTKYEQKVQEEIDSVKAVYSKRNDSKTKETHKKEHESSISEYNEVVKNMNYVNYSDISKEEVKKETMNEKPYVISPEDFGEIDEYDRISLTYYSDNILADDLDEIVENVDDVVGVESLTHFGEFEDDSVFVRNDKKKCDFEILLDERKYSDVVNPPTSKPREVEV